MKQVDGPTELRVEPPGELTQGVGLGLNDVPRQAELLERTKPLSRSSVHAHRRVFLDRSEKKSSRNCSRRAALGQC